jgi:hypothetical protein
MKGGKIHLHKVNGVKIAVPVTKMSVEDLEYVERATGESLDDDKPLSDLKRRSTLRAKEQGQGARSSLGISVEKKPDYDWFDFFLKCGVNPQICERYAQAFHRDQMGEENLPDITPALLRTLGLKEGDILRVTKHLETKFGGKQAEDGGEGSSGGLFSGPGGTLRNNTRKGRPAPPVQTSDVVDAKAFEPKTDDSVKKPAQSTPAPSASKSERQADGFDDNAWDVKPSRSVSGSAPPPATSPPPAQQAPPPAAAPKLTGSMNDLSLLDMPALKPELIAQPTPPAPAPQPAQAPPQQQPAPVQPQPTGATPTLFEQVAAIKALTQPHNMAPPRMRPQPPPQNNTGGMIAPPPMRSSSAPMGPGQSAFGPPAPLQPQLTGYNPNMQQQMTGMPGQNGFGYQQNGMMPQPTGYNSMSPPPQMPMQTGFQQPMQTGFQQPMQTGFQQPMQTGFQQPMQTGFQQPGFQNGSPFADPPRAPFQPMQAQPTGYNSFQPSPLNPQATGVNRFLPPAIQPQPTGFGQSAPPMPPMPPMPSMPTAQALVPQKTGPPPPIRFGVQAAKKLTPQPTGKASLANASKSNTTVKYMDFVLTTMQHLKTPLASKHAVACAFPPQYCSTAEYLISSTTHVHVHNRTGTGACCTGSGFPG